MRSRRLIMRMVRENPIWGEERVVAEFSVNLGTLVSPRNVLGGLHHEYWLEEIAA